MLLVIPAGFYDDLFGIVVRVYPVLSIKTNTSNTYTKAIDRYLYDPVQGLPGQPPTPMGWVAYHYYDYYYHYSYYYDYY